MHAITTSILVASLSFLVLTESAKLCQRPHSWSIKQVNPLAEARSKGHVVLLGLMLASWRFCKWQAQLMERMLKGVVKKRNFTDISFMILNMKRASGSISELQRRVSFPVYQEPANRDIMGLLGGSKDDFLIFDRCGLLAYHFKMPRSYLMLPFVRNALIKEYTKKGSKCKRHCPIKTTTTATQATTNKPSTSSEFSASYSSESVESQPQSDATTTSSPVTTTDLTVIRRKETP